MKAMMMTALLSTLTAAVAQAQQTSPYTKPNDSWIVISGTVKSAGPDSFLLDYGKGTVTVDTSCCKATRSNEHRRPQGY